MAPEQNEGTMLFQSDVYGFGIILYEILAGVVPFPLKDNGQTARNNVMVSHMEMPVPDVLELRKQHVPETWSEEKKQREMQVPKWLLDLIYRCLEKNPDNRFADGVELYEAILHNSNHSITPINEGIPVLKSENERLQTLVTQEQERAKKLEQQLNSFRNNLAQKEQELLALQSGVGNYSVNDTNAVSISKPVFISLVLLLTCLVAFAGYSLLTKKPDTVAKVATRSDSTSFAGTLDTATEIPKYISKKEQRQQKEDSVLLALKDSINSETIAVPEPASETNTEETPAVTSNENGNDDIGKVFTLAVKEAYFHDKPDPATRRNAFINHWNNARLTALNDLNGFIYVSYKNDEGVVTKGWLNKKDLIIIGE
jgi:serine/threonine protein kinase